jgi:hypothetical protein
MLGPFLSLVILNGCGALFPAAPQFPITDGFHNVMPNRNSRIVVWAEHPSLNGTATTWLQKRGLTVVERARLKQVLDEQMIRLTHTADDEANLLKAGKLLGAEIVVFMDSAQTAGQASSFSINQYGGGGSSTTLYSASVSVRAVNVESGEVVWSGHARYRDPVTGVNDAIVKLTCQALATAWGLRPVGQHDISSDSMCLVETPAAN